MIYWFVYSSIILCFDFIISWRVYSYELGIPDYWLASAIFCPVIDFIAFDSIMLFILHLVKPKG